MVIPGKNAFKEGNLCSNCKTRQMLKTRSLACPNTSVYCCHLQAAPTTGRSVRNQQAENCIGNKALGWGCSRLAPHCAHHHRQLLGWGGGCMGWGSVLREWGWSTPRHLEWHRVLVFRHHSQPQSSDTRLGR